MKPGLEFVPAGSLLQSAVTQPSVAILLATYNGERFLSEQLQSIERQIHKNWKLFISDDQSTDSTYLQALSFQMAHPDRCRVFQHRRGESFALNFMSLALNSEVEADFYAFCDQDDIWDEKKLERALNSLAAYPESLPILYCSRTTLVNAENEFIGFSPLHTKAPSFQNALTQNIGGGNTMVFNSAAMRLIRQVSVPDSTISHDWWIYLVVSACGGKVIYDRTPFVRYRQHKENAIGGKARFAARMKRLLSGAIRESNEQNLKALDRVLPFMPPQHRALIANFQAARQAPTLLRLRRLRSLGLYRQSTIGSLGFGLAALLNKV